MILDLKYVLIGFLIIASIIPLYIYRKQIYRRLYKKGSTKGFMKDCEIYLVSNHPKIPFDFSIEKKYRDEKDIRVKETLIVEDFINQYLEYEYDLITQKSVPKESLWAGYEANSRLIKDNKRPIDWAKRKEAAWNRDKGLCNRCGTKIKLVDAQVLLAKQMKDGGGFNLENIVILCTDCAKVIKSANKQKTAKDLNITYKLMKKVEG
ncbi:HNH endonuclease [Arcobacter sp. CECT 8983]|uniref:HNH endonuclease n=1 Tax=Arcobacter sp. CECT 8983 TaxID=2044508 RepID=UPI00100B7B0E|nr:HNH endonuclease [Arcobacter sp. CECT 8983]RXJ90518.1 HNH endonuclease [Arcobacter sp. CECT 8983]